MNLVWTIYPNQNFTRHPLTDVTMYSGPIIYIIFWCHSNDIKIGITITSYEVTYHNTVEY